MILYEIVNGEIGESYCRAYAWAENETHAHAMFVHENPGVSIQELRIIKLFDSQCGPFCTKLDDGGWKMVSYPFANSDV